MSTAMFGPMTFKADQSNITFQSLRLRTRSVDTQFTGEPLWIDQWEIFHEL